MVQAATGELAVSAEQPPLGELPGERELLARASGENFSVASLLLPRRERAHLLAIYGYARLVDQIGDAVAGDRLAQLDAVETALRGIFEHGEPPLHPVLARLASTIEALELPPAPFLALLEANRQDQLTKEYASYAQLLAYCELSANPVGELVLHVFGVATPERIARSNAVCSALQLAEHWQDVAEDFAAGRIYLPAEDRERFGVGAAELGGSQATEALVALLAFECERARGLLDEGAPLVGTLGGRARFAVAGYVGGGRAALEAIEAAGFDVLAGPPRARRGSRLRRSLEAYRSGR
jgi:squalene synthase HpnC